MAKYSFKEKKEEILNALEKLKNSSSTDALQLIKVIYNETCNELGIENKAFFSNPEIAEKVLELAYLYESDDKILENFIGTIIQISRRFDVNNQNMFDFLIRHIQSKNKRIQMLIARRLALMPQFDNYLKKWEYILSIPKITPTKDSINYFRWAIAHRINEIPNDLKENVIEILENHISKSNIGSEHFMETLNKIKNI